VHVHEHLPLEELQRLTGLIKETRLWKRHQAIILAMQGHTSLFISRQLGCARSAVQKWVTQYNHSGPQALQEKPHPGRPPRLSGPELLRFQERVEAGPRPEEERATFDGLDDKQILEEEFGVLLSLQGVYDLLHRHGFSSLMPRPQHKDADEELQAIFKEVVADQIQAIREAHPEEKVEVFFEDEARFGQQGTMARVWALKGSRPRAVRQTQYGYLYVLTAVCAATGMAMGLISPSLNVGVINVFLEQFSRELPAGTHAILIWDGAGYHTSGDVVVPADVSLIELVPYSPELNPVENLWHYLRSHYWSLRVYVNVDALEAAAMSAWQKVCLVPELVKTVCAAPYVNDKI